MVTVDDNQSWSLEREVLDLIADKWAMLIVNALGPGTLRFTELEDHVGGISHKMLAQTLRGLERHGIVSRFVHATVPPRVDYTLTESGQDLLAVAIQLCSWTKQNRQQIEAARDSFDRARG